jgi:uncharacterized protein (TIGR03790 family)
MSRLAPLWAGLLLLGVVASAPALGPEEVYLVCNRNVPESRAIAEHYCRQRKVPRDHILALDLPAGEDISRDSYNRAIAQPLRRLLEKQREQVKVLLTVYGVPLRVGGDEPTAQEKSELERLQKQLEQLEKEKKELSDTIGPLTDKVRKEPSDKLVRQLDERKKELAGREARLEGLHRRRKWLSHAESLAAVDSELALLWYDRYELRRWQVNPLYFQVPAKAREGKPPVIMTCRLDGPRVELIKRLIDQAIAVEKKGLEGKVYVDARGNKYSPKGDPGLGYGGYDESLREMARLLEQGHLPVVLDDKSELFAVGSCPECALYCGWYSHAKFVDCCRFVPGAVAYHIASSEAVSLRDPKAPFWCKNLLEKGAIATLGPVSEPYTIGFPKPAEMFGFLATGKYTLVECYWKTEMLASWMTVLVGDPLYNPFAKSPRLEVDQVRPSPKGGSVQALIGIR